MTTLFPNYLSLTCEHVHGINNIFNFKTILVNKNIHIMCVLQIVILYQYYMTVD